MKYAEINLRVEQEKLIMKNLKALSRMTMRAAIGLYTFQLTAIPYRLTIDFAYTLIIYKVYFANVRSTQKDTTSTNSTKVDR